MSEPNFEGLDADGVRKLVDDLLGRCMEPRWRHKWWSSAIDGQTPEQMLEGARYKQLWQLAEAACDPAERDITDVLRQE